MLNTYFPYLQREGSGIKLPSGGFWRSRSFAPAPNKTTPNPLASTRLPCNLSRIPSQIFVATYTDKRFRCRFGLLPEQGWCIFTIGWLNLA